MSVSAVAQIEQGGRTDPHYSTLEKLAGALNMSVGELLEEPALAGKGEASREAGPLSPEWALRVNSDLFRATIRDAANAELRELGASLIADFAHVRTRDELLKEGPAPDVQRVRAFSLAGVVNEELVRREEEPLWAYVLAFRRFENAMSGGEEASVPEEVDQEHRAG
jgi:transcriptional regulator with XRE-family HTH domain